MPQPLHEGVCLCQRYEISRTLGQGGFGITYLASDTITGSACVLKELAPALSERDSSGRLSFAALGQHASQRLRHQFLQEAGLFKGVKIEGVLPVRDAFQENNTSYYVTDYLEGAGTLERLLQQEGRLDADGALDILMQLLETLEQIHLRGILHRDIKPSNVLVDPKGKAFLIDFGSARAWHSDLTEYHTVQYTPGYAPIEQMSERAIRGPASDIYGLCSTAYALLTGEPPCPALDRVAGSPLIPLKAVRPDVEVLVCQAIEAGLGVQFESRPQSVAEFRELLKQTPPVEVVGPEARIKLLDEKLCAVREFHFDRSECPSCGGALESPRPLSRNSCPVCRDGNIRMRAVETNLCPSCRVGILKRRSNVCPLAICPVCSRGRLNPQGFALWYQDRRYVCSACPARMIARRQEVMVEGSDDQLDWSEWRRRSGRSSAVWICDTCEAQYDELADGRMEQMLPMPEKYRCLFPDEWSRVAAGLDPGAGNAVCDICEADFFVDGEHMTLLGAKKDLYGFAEQNCGRLLDREAVRWIAVGKTSGHRGLRCSDCSTEFDTLAEGLRLVHSDHDVLRGLVTASETLEDWHRLARKLPRAGREFELEQEMSDALLNGWLCGVTPLDSRSPDTVWRGPASRWGVCAGETRMIDSSTLTITREEITYGGLLKKVRVPLDLIERVGEESGLIYLSFGAETLHFEIEPLEMHVRLASGKWTIDLTGSDLAKRLRGVLGAQ